MTSSGPDFAAAVDEVAPRAYEDTLRRLAGGVKPPHIVNILVERGLQPDVAIAFVDQTNREYRRAMAISSLRGIRNGFIWAVGGTIVTALTYTVARGGDYFIIAYGPVIYGVYAMIKGFIRWLGYRRA